MSKLNDERLFRNFWEMNIVPRLERYREEREKNGTTWDNPRIIMMYRDRVLLYLAEVGGTVGEKEFEKISAIHEKMRRFYDETIAVIGGEE